MAATGTLYPSVWTLPAALSGRLGSEPGPQRALLEDGHLLLVLHQIPNPDEHARRAALFWRSPDATWRSNRPGAGITALQAHLREYEETLIALEQAENRATSAAEYHGVLERLAPVLRASRGLHRALQQAREMVKPDRNLIDLRDQAAGIERTAELLLQDAQFGLNFTAARQAEAQAATARQMAATAHRLNLLAAFFLPLTALASVFGMEIHSRLADTPQNFLWIAGGGLLLGCLVTLIVLRKGRP